LRNFAAEKNAAPSLNTCSNSASKYTWRRKTLVNLVEEWADVEEYAQECRHGYYQTRDAVDGTEIRVHVGRLGYVHVFKDANDPQLKRVINFCKAEGFIKILGNISDELFFT
jgi:hypothetical protein